MPLLAINFAWTMYERFHAIRRKLATIYKSEMLSAHAKVIYEFPQIGNSFFEPTVKLSLHMKYINK